MAYFAELNSDNIVLRVVVVNDLDIMENGKLSENKGIEFCKSLWGSNTLWKQTSDIFEFRKNYAGIGYTYNADIDAFVPPKPYSSWILNSDTAQWQAPIAMPDDGKAYSWNENTQSWNESEGNV